MTTAWSYDLRIRSVWKLDGTPDLTYKPAIAPLVCDPSYDWEQIDRRLADGSDDPVPKGWRPRLSLTIVARDGCMKGAPGYFDLEDVLACVDADRCLEIALHTEHTEDGDIGTDYRRCFLVPGSVVEEPLEGKYIGVQVSLEFQANARITTLPKRNGAAW